MLRKEQELQRAGSGRELETVRGQESVLQEERESKCTPDRWRGSKRMPVPVTPPGGAVCFDYWTV